MILVTGAAGKTGLAVVEQLSTLGQPVRALVRTSASEQALLEVGAREAVSGDLRDAGRIRTAMEGVGSVYHIPPNMHPDEFEIGKVVIEAARASGVDYLVYHSVLHPHVQAMPHHWQKMRVEELIFSSGLDFTILQPTAYMQNILGQWSKIESHGFFEMPYPVETKLSLVDLQDVAEVAAAVLTREGHRGAIYELVGTRALSQLEVAALLSDLLGNEVRADTISIEDWETHAKDAGLKGYAIESLIKMFQYYTSYGFEGNPSVLRWLLGREPTGLMAAFRRDLDVQRHADEAISGGVENKRGG